MQIFPLTLVATLAVQSASAEESEFIISDAFIRSINQKQTTWVAGRNFPEDTPIEKLRRLTGVWKEPAHVRTSRLKVHPRSSIDIPDSFDAREAWPYCESTKRIRNQASCGACWTFCAVEVMTDRLCIATKGEVKFDFSPEDVIACCNCGDCGGGSIANTFDYWISDGIVSGGDYYSKKGCQPYQLNLQTGNSTDMVCTRTCLNENYTISYDDDKHYGASAYSIANDMEQIQIEVMTNGPVTVVFDFYDDLYNYQSGVYQQVSGNNTSAHAVKLLGWGVEDGTPYWLLANSWGYWWAGFDGFFKFLRGQNHCSIEANVYSGLPRI